MKKWFEKWTAEKIKRKEKGLPPVVDHRDVDYVSGSGPADEPPTPTELRGAG
jgi:hypothetical protein